uniref:Basic leucine zipper and W2 domains 1a n=1 Tax=Oryzias sinensis TaxID=183150 RepID=A0A8C8DPA9_9TELE
MKIVYFTNLYILFQMPYTSNTIYCGLFANLLSINAQHRLLGNFWDLGFWNCRFKHPDKMANTIDRCGNWEVGHEFRDGQSEEKAVNLTCFVSFKVSFMNNQKQQKPTLTGQRFKTRKRDEKERFDPTHFQESIVQGLNQTGTDLEAVAKFLDASGAKLDYRRYAETLFDILVAGGMLAPGGTLSDDMTRTEFCLFRAQEDLETMQAYAQVFNKLIRRYKYLEKGFEEEIKKLLLFLKGFTESERNKLAMLTGILLANGNISASILSSLFNENLVKEGVSAAFAVKLFKSWIAEKDINSVAGSLRKVGMDNRLMELFPANKRSCEHFSKYFTDAGLKELSDFARNQQSIGARKELQKELQEMMGRGDPQKEVGLV